MPEDTKPSPPNYRWNFTAFVLDYATFLIGFGFVSSVTILPALARQLTTSAPLIGLTSAMFRAGWTLPQLATARLVEGKPRKKPFFYIGVPIRIVLPAIAVALWAGLARHPGAMLLLLLLGMFLFAMSDGFMTLVWFDIMARVIPADRRVRMLGLAQVIGGFAGIGVGALVGLILDRWPFPQNYALLFTCASVGIAISSIATLSIREPAPEETLVEPRRDRHSWLRPLARDRDYRRLISSRLLVGMASLATPFYVIHAADVMHLPEKTIGAFVIANTLGSLVSSAVLGLAGERRGPRFIIHVSTAIAASGPLFVLLVHLIGSRWLTAAYPYAFVALGISTSAWMLGFTNYTLEMAPDGHRPAYVGLGNTLMGLLAFVPALGGWLLEASSYTVLFAVASAMALAGMALAFTLRPSQDIARKHAANGV